MRRQRSVGSALTELFLRLGALAGALIGLLAGFQRVTHEKPGPVPLCKTGSCLGHEASRTLVNSMVTVLGPAILGAVIGIAVVGLGVLVVRLLVPTVSRQRAIPDVTKLATRPATSRNGTWMSARYHGKCHACRAEIRPGDPILHSRAPRATWCVSCGRA
jgi:hypothetical protein